LRVQILKGHLLSFSSLVLAICLAPIANAQESHLTENGSGSLISRSAFAHGYRHGYEEGYHFGNVDINMGRLDRTQTKKQFQGLKPATGYSPSFGPQALFHAGFQAGFKAGYHDGYDGRNFRAVDSARALSMDLEKEPLESERSKSYFDQGLASGYQEGFRKGEASSPAERQIDLRQVKCPESGPNSADQSSYCGGYRRGFVLGHTDALALRPGFVYLEASK
jgi:flagellar biosynthesis/type III secretory pathway protein FliH